MNFLRVTSDLSLNDGTLLRFLIIRFLLTDFVPVIKAAVDIYREQ